MLNGFEEKTVGGLAGTETSPGLCLRQQHLSSLVVSSANISLQRTRGFLQLYFLKILCSVCFSFFLNLLSLSHFSVPLSHCCYTISYLFPFSPAHSCRISLFVHFMSLEALHSIPKYIFHGVPQRVLSCCHKDKFTSLF